MRLTVQLEDKRFTSLMRGKSDYIDVKVDGEVVRFLVNDLGTTIEYTTRIISSRDLEDIMFRLPTKIFLSILNQSAVEFVTSEDSIIVRVLREDGKFNELSFRRQMVNQQPFEEADQLRKELNEGYPKINLEQYVLFSKLATFVGDVVNSDNGVLYCCSNKLQVYQEEVDEERHSLSILAKDLGLIRKVSDTIYSVRNYAVACDGGFLMFIRKVKSSRGSDYEFLRKRKVTKFYTMQIEPIKSALMLQQQNKQGDLIINFSKDFCSLKTDSFEYKVPLEIYGKKKESLEDILEGKVEEDVWIRLDQFQSGLLKLLTDEVKFSVFRNFIRIDTGMNLFLIIARGR